MRSSRNGDRWVRIIILALVKNRSLMCRSVETVGRIVVRISVVLTYQRGRRSNQNRGSLVVKRMRSDPIQDLTRAESGQPQRESEIKNARVAYVQTVIAVPKAEVVKPDETILHSRSTRRKPHWCHAEIAS